MGKMKTMVKAPDVKDMPRFLRKPGMVAAPTPSFEMGLGAAGEHPTIPEPDMGRGNVKVPSMPAFKPKVRPYS